MRTIKAEWILLRLIESLPQISPANRYEPLRLLHRIILPDTLEFERHPGPLSRLALPDPDVLPPLLALDVGSGLVSREEYRVAEGLEERERVVADDDPPERRLSGVAGVLVGLVEDEFHAAVEDFVDGGGFDEDVTLRYTVTGVTIDIFRILTISQLNNNQTQMMPYCFPLVMSKRESRVQAFEAVLAGVRGQGRPSGAGIKYPSSTGTPADIRIYADCQQYR